MIARGMGFPGLDRVPRVSGARSSARSEFPVGASVEETTREGFSRWAAARRAARALHAVLLFLLCCLLPTLARLYAGVSTACAGPLLLKYTCSTPSLYSSTYLAHIPFAQHSRYNSLACWDVLKGTLLLGGGQEGGELAVILVVWPAPTRGATIPLS